MFILKDLQAADYVKNLVGSTADQGPFREIVNAVLNNLALLVIQRTREIGIRMALGAEAGSVLRMVMGQVSR